MDSTEPGPGEVLHIPLDLLRVAAREVGATAEQVAGARSRPSVLYDAGPGQAAVGALVADVDGVLAGLGRHLDQVSGALTQTANDLADTDRRERVRLFESAFGLVDSHGPEPGPP